MTERMKDHLRQPCVLTELCKLFENDPILTGPSIGKCHHQIEVLILVAKEAFQLVLGLLPFQQNVGQSLGQPHLADAGIGFRLFQNNSSPGAGKSAASVLLWLFRCGDRIGCFFGWVNGITLLKNYADI